MVLWFLDLLVFGKSQKKPSGVQFSSAETDRDGDLCVLDQTVWDADILGVLVDRC